MATVPPSLGFQSSAARRDRHTCNCRNSKCLKLYCECFASGDYCHNCNCSGCFNIAKFEVPLTQAHRIEAIHNILERNPIAFRRKSAHYAPGAEATDIAKHYKGCACKRSGCLKKYCECFQAGISCSGHCKCTDWYALCSKNIDDLRGSDAFDDTPVKRRA